MTAWRTPSAGLSSPCAPPGVGRQREFATLRERLAALLLGRGGLVLIGGEEGVGKTTLATALCREAQEAGALVLVGHCYDLASRTPYSLWDDLAARYSCDESLPPLPAALVRQGTAPPACQESIVAAVRAFLAASARQRPLVLLLEDLHWADPASLDLLRDALRHLEAGPFLAVCTYRSEALPGDHPLQVRMATLVREAIAARLDLGGLTTAEVGELVAARYTLAPDDARRLVRYLHQRAEGNPLFIAELLRTAEEEGHLRETPAGWHLGDLSQVGVPPLLRQLLDARLCHLGHEDRHLLALAAAIGRDVPLDLWAAVAGVTEEALLDTVERCAALHLLAGTRDGARVRFVHTLLREACYEGALSARRRGWHRRIAEALAGQPHRDPDAVAHHFQRAGDARAVEWLVRAGDGACRTAAYAVALERYEAAAAVLDETGVAGECGWLRYRLARARSASDPARGRVEFGEVASLAATAGDRALAAVARYHHGHEQFLAGEYEAGLARVVAAVAELEVLPPEEWVRLAAHADLTGLADVSACLGTLIADQVALGHFPAALAALERWGPPHDAPVPERLPPDPQSAAGLLGLAQLHASLGRPRQAREVLARARDHYAALGLPGEFAAAACEMTQVLLPYYADQRTLWQALADDVERACRRADDLGQHPAAVACRALFLAAAGDWAGARAQATAALGEAYPASAVPLARCVLGRLARDQGEPDLAWEQVRQALPAGAATAPGTVPLALALELLHLAATLAIDAGDPQGARPWLDAAERWLSWSKAVRWQADQQLLWGRYHRATGDVARAYHAAAEAITRAGEPRQPLALLAAHRLLGELAIELGRLRDAATHLAAARPLAEACALPHERALTLLALAELWAAEGRREAAAAPLAEARRIGAALGAAPIAARADALAARLAAPPAAHPAGLSAREVEVLRLLSRGATNRAIADELYLSERTVQVHVRHILTKTDTANRAAAAAFALRNNVA